MRRAKWKFGNSVVSSAQRRWDPAVITASPSSSTIPLHGIFEQGLTRTRYSTFTLFRAVWSNPRPAGRVRPSYSFCWHLPFLLDKKY
jgi:hypothetical protein